MTQTTDIVAGLADSAQDYDWSEAQNRTVGVPQNGANTFFNVANIISLDNVGNLTLNELFSM